MRVAAAIRQGRLCRSCTKECRDLGTQNEPIEIECPCCSGAGCKNCNEGSVNIVGCPSQYCKSVSDAVRLFELFERGIMPIAGGALDQSAWFLAAQRQFRIDDLTMSAEADRE